ncbi:hypothetical protein ES703_60924 [subsurface metagenome]
MTLMRDMVHKKFKVPIIISMRIMTEDILLFLLPIKVII